MKIALALICRREDNNIYKKWPIQVHILAKNENPKDNRMKIGFGSTRSWLISIIGSIESIYVTVIEVK